MKKPHSPLSQPRTQLVSTVQKGFFCIVLLLIISAFGLYKFMDVGSDQRSSHNNDLLSLENRLHHAEIDWLEWLSISDSQVSPPQNAHSVEEIHNALMNEYSEINLQLSVLKKDDYQLSDLNVDDVLSFLKKLEKKVKENVPISAQERSSIYDIIKKNNRIDIKLMEVEVSEDFNDAVFNHKITWLLFAVFSGLSIVVILFGYYFVRRLSKGLSHLQLVLERHKQGGLTQDANYHRIDEFTDIGRLVDNELSAREFDRQAAQDCLDVIQLAIGQLNAPFLIAKHNGDVVWVSQGLMTLWKNNIDKFEAYFEIDDGLDSPLGEQLSSRVLLGLNEARLLLIEGNYVIHIQRIGDVKMNLEEGQQEVSDYYLMTLTSLSDMAEIEVIRKSAALMRQDVWSLPIRILREDSPFSAFSRDLEGVRQRVQSLIECAQEKQNLADDKVKITKLQQIETLLNKEINDNHSYDEDVLVVPKEVVHPLSDVQLLDELGSMSYLSEQIHDSVLVGYELLLQRLTMVEKDIAGDAMLLDEVYRCLNEVRAGVLSSLAATDGESETVRRRFSMDLNHDIDTVQRHIESIKEMVDSTLSLLAADRSVGLARLERAKQSVVELGERIHVLLDKERSYQQDEASPIGLISKNDNSDQIDEF